MSKDYPLHPGQTHTEPLCCTIPLEEYEGLKKKIRSLENELSTTNALLEQRNAEIAVLKEDLAVATGDCHALAGKFGG